MFCVGSPAKLESGTGAIAVYIYILKNRPYTLKIITKLSTQMNNPPISVTAHKGILSKKPQSSIAVTISCGNIVACGVPNPAEFMIVLTTP